MADINQVITLGIGTPAGIPEFLTFGLQLAEAGTGIVLSDTVEIRFTASDEVEIRFTASEEVEL